MVEIWKDVVGYEGFYVVSNKGNVKSLKRKVDYRGSKKIIPAQKMTIRIDKYGYPRVALCKNGKQKHYRVHRLMALAFIPNPEMKLTVNHKDSNKSNNNLDNLEWATYAENNDHCLKFGKRKFDVDEELLVEKYKSGYTMKQVGKIMGISSASVYKFLKLNNIKSRKQGKKGKYYKTIKEGVDIEWEEL